MLDLLYHDKSAELISLDLRVCVCIYIYFEVYEAP